MNRRRIRDALLASLGLALAGGCGTEEAPPPAIIRPVLAMKAADAQAFAERSFTGRAKATREANIAFEVSGRLVERSVLVGQTVEQGQLLARLDPRDFQNALDQAEASQQRAQAFRDRIALAAKTGSVSQQELTDAEAGLEIARAEVQIRQKALEDSRLYAPFSGTISTILVENHENVRAKQVIMRLLDTSKIEMIVDIPEALISLAPYVKSVKVTFDAFPDREVPATIKEISNEASLLTRTYGVNLIMDQPADIKILPGMAGRASGRPEVPGNLDETGVELSVSAVFSDDGERSYVWVIEDGVAHRREVEVGQLSARGIIVSGVKRGEWIAIAGVHTLEEGQKVRILESGGRS